MKNILRSLFLTKPVRNKIALLIVIAIISAGLSSVTPFIIRDLINSLVKLLSAHQSTSVVTSALLTYLGLFAIVGIFDAAFSSWESAQTNKVSSDLYVTISIAGFKKLAELSLDYFEVHRPGAILRKVNDGIGSISGWIYDLAYNFLAPAGLMFFGLIALWLRFPVIGLIATVAFPVQIYLFLRTAKKARPIYKNTRKAAETADGHLNETFSHIATIRTMSAEQANYQKFEKNINLTRKYDYQAADMWRLSMGMRIIISRLVYALCIGLTAFMVLNRRATIGDIIFVSLFLQQVMGQAISLGRFFDVSIRRDVTIGRLLEVLDTKISLQDKSDALPLVALESIEFKNVSFTYPDGKKGAIHNLNFTIEGNKTLALVGPSGTGKSTITKLLLRFYEPTEGEILVNGRDISDFTGDSIRQHMGVVMQDVALFNTTVEENLAIANSRVTKDKVRAAAHQAHADEFIKDLPKGYKTLVGERGIKLSGGQKQRVAIARAILKDPQLIILDEATSALDSESERLVQDGLQKLMKGRSALIIAHRLSTIRHADEILVLKNGMIAERGNHEELINLTGLYKKLFDLQSSSGKVQL